MTYRDNINGLLARQRTNLGQRRKNTADLINFQQEQQKELETNIGKATDLLVGDPSRAFGAGLSGQGFQTEGQGIFPTLYGEHVKRKREEGAEAADKDKAERLEHMVSHFERLRETDTAHHAVKRNMLLNGAYYDDADRFTKLSPHAQVGYAQQKLNLYKESFADKLNHWMARNPQEYNFNNNIVTPESIHNNHQYPLLIKEHLLNKGVEEISKQNGIDGFSDDMLTLAGINDFTDPDTGNITQGVHSKAKADIMAKYRKNYNVEASAKLRIEHFSELMSDPTAAGSIHRFLVKVGTTVDENNQLLNWSGGWKELQNLLIDQLVAGKIDTDQVDAMFQQEIPGRPGKTYASEYGARLEDIKRLARNEIEANITAENNAANNGAQRYEIKTKNDLKPGGRLDIYIRDNGPLTDDQVQMMNKEWIAAGGFNNGNLPDFLSNIHTKQEQDQDAILERVKKLLQTRTYITEYDVKGADAATMQAIKALPGFDANYSAAINSGDAFKTIGKEGGWEPELRDALGEYLTLTGGDRNPGLFERYLRGLEGEYKKTYRDLLHAGKISPEQAHDAAMLHVLGKMGIIPQADGKTVSREEAKNFVEPLIKAPDLKALKESNLYQAQRIDQGKNIIDKAITGMDAGDLNKAPLVLLPTVGVDSYEWQQAKLFADSDGREGSIAPYYKELARLYPRFTAEDLINWQLKAGGHGGLKSYSSFYEAINSEGMREFKRIISFKPTPASTVQSKIQAIDVSTSLRHASLRAELNLEHPVRAPDDKSLIADKKRLKKIAEKELKEDSKAEVTEEDTAQTGGTGIEWGSLGQAVETIITNIDSSGLDTTDVMAQNLRESVENNQETIKKVITDIADATRTTDTTDILAITSRRATTKERLTKLAELIVRAAGQPTDTTEMMTGQLTEALNEFVDSVIEPLPEPAQDVSYLQSVWNVPGSPVLSAHLQDYSVTLYNEKVLNATAV